MSTAADTPTDIDALPPLEAGRRTRFAWWQVAGAVVAVLVAAYFGGHWFLYDRHRVTTDDAIVDTDQVFVTSKISERVAKVLVDENQFVHRGDVLAVLDAEDERAALRLAERNLESLTQSAQGAHNAMVLEQQTQAAQIVQGAAGVDAARMATGQVRLQMTAAARAVSVARAQVAAAEGQVAIADAAVPAAREGLRRAEADFARAKTLAAQGYVPASSVEAASLAVAQARAAEAQATSQSRAARLAVRAAEATLAQQIAASEATAGNLAVNDAQARLAFGHLSESAAGARVPAKASLAGAAFAQADAMRQQVRMAQLALANTTVRAPADGWISARNAQEGQTVGVGQAIFTLSPANRIFVTANYKETQLARIHAGELVDISIDACGGKTVRGRVAGLAPVGLSSLSTLPALAAPSNFVKVAQRVPVRIVLPPSDGGCVYRPGTMVETSIIAD